MIFNFDWKDESNQDFISWKWEKNRGRISYRIKGWGKNYSVSYYWKTKFELAIFLVHASVPGDSSPFLWN